MRESLDAPDASSENLVLDSWPLMEWLKGREPVAGRFRKLLIEARMGRKILWLSSINQGEVYYNCVNEWNRERAEQVLAGFAILPIHIMHPTRDDVVAAARIKAEWKVSYAHAFAAVLAIELSGSVLTGDPDFLKLGGASLVAVDWWGE